MPPKRISVKLTAEAAKNKRREYRRRIIGIQTILRSNDIKIEDKAEMQKQIQRLRGQIQKLSNIGDKSKETDITQDEISQRRAFVDSNNGLKDIFTTFWLIFLPYTTQNELTKEGYIKFQQMIQVALIGNPNFEDILANADHDFNHDLTVFQKFDQQGFNDLLFETIETYSEILDPHYYAAFSWSLLDSVADTSKAPPKLRPFREIRCITKLENEASMIKNYLQGRKMRAALTIGNEWLARVPDVQKRLQARKVGHSFNPDDKDMVFALQNSLPLKTGKLPGNHDDNVSSDEDISIASQEIDKKGVTTNILLEKPINDEDSECEIIAEISTTDESSVVAEVVKPLPQTGRGRQSTISNYQPRQSTASFLNYVQARRSSKAILNGGGYMLQTAALRPSMLQANFHGDDSEDEDGSYDDDDDGSNSKTSFNDFVSSGKRLEKFKTDLTEAEKLERRNRRMKQMKFDIHGTDSDDPMQSKGEYSRSQGGMYGNIGVELTPAVTAITLDPNLSKPHTSPKKKDMVRLLGESDDEDMLQAPSSYLLHLDTEADNASIQSNNSKNVLLFQQIKQKRLTEHEIRTAMTDQLKNTSKYGVAKVSHVVGVDPVDLKVLLESSKLLNEQESNNKSSGIKKADDTSVNTDDAMRSNFRETDFIEPSHAKHFHDPFNPDIVNAYEHGQANKQMAVETMRFIQSHPTVNNVSTYQQPYDRILEAQSSRFKNLLSPQPSAVMLPLSSPAWDVSRAMNGLKMPSNRKQKLTKTIQQATVSSLMEQSTKSTFSALINVSSASRSPSKSPVAAERSPDRTDPFASIAYSDALMIGSSVDSNRELSPAKLPDINDELEHSGDFGANNNNPSTELVSGEALEKSLVISEQRAGKSTTDLVVDMMPSVHNPEGRDGSTVLDLSVQSPQERISFRASANGGSFRSNFSNFSDDIWSVDSTAPPLLKAPSSAVDVAPPTKLSRMQKAASKKAIQSKDESLVLDMSSYDDLMMPTSNLPSPAGLEPNKATTSNSLAVFNKRPKTEMVQKQLKFDVKPTAMNSPKRGMVDPNFASSSMMPMLTVKPIVELPRVKTTKKEQKKKTSTNNDDTTGSKVSEGIAHSKSGARKGRPASPPRTNSPPLTKRLQSPSSSPMILSDVDAFVTVLGSSAEALPGFDPRSFDYVDSDIRFFSTSVPSHSMHTSILGQSQPNLANSAYAPFNTNSTFNLTAPSSYNNSASTSSLNPKKVPWLPKGTLTPLEHDRSDCIQGWREKIEYLKFQPFDTAKIPMTIRNQAAAKQAFEQYAKSFANQELAGFATMNGNVHKK